MGRVSKRPQPATLTAGPTASTAVNTANYGAHLCFEYRFVMCCARCGRLLLYYVIVSST